MGFRRRLGYLLPILLASIAIDTYAIGDSGGCGDPLDGHLGKALKTGTRAQFENAVNNWVEYKEKNLSLTEKLVLFVKGGKKAKAQWRAQQVRNLIEGIHGEEESCVPGPLFPVAVNAGNIEVVRFLLSNPMGVSPNISTDFLFACDSSVLITSAQRQRRREAYALVLDAKMIDLHKERYAIAALQSCKEPELITLFLERGARPDVLDARRGGQIFLEYAILDAVRFEEGSYLAEKTHGVERARIFSQLGLNSIEGSSVEREIRRECNLIVYGKRLHESACKTLATFITASPSTFGDY